MRSARLRDIEASMQRATDYYMDRQSSGLQWLALTYQIVPLLGFLGTVITLYAALNLTMDGVAPTALGGYLGIALAPTAAGILIAVVLYSLHRLMRLRVQDLRRNVRTAVSSLVRVMVEEDPELLESGDEKKPSTYRRLLKPLMPNRGMINRMMVIQAGVVIVFGFMLITVGPAHGRIAEALNAPNFSAGVLVGAIHQKPRLFIAAADDITLSHGFNRGQVVALADLEETLLGIEATELLLFADQSLPYAVMEDILEQVRAAGVGKVTFMSPEAYIP